MPQWALQSSIRGSKGCTPASFSLLRGGSPAATLTTSRQPPWIAVADYLSEFRQLDNVEAVSIVKGL